MRTIAIAALLASAAALLWPSPPRVVALHPGAERVPANLLRFYVDFSEPMEGGDAYAHLRLLDAHGAPVRDAFREIELWSRDRTRLMVYLHPGRIKRGLVFAETEGPVLREGERYTIEVSAGLRSRRGRATAERFACSIEAGPADHEQPDVGRWTLGRDVEVDEWLDEAGLEERVRVDGRTGQVDGRRIRFDLAPGEHELVVDPQLEDLCGNSFVRPFEAPPGADERRAPVTRRFVVR